MVTATALIVEHTARPFVVDTVELEPLRALEVLVELKATGVCHTDVAVQHGKLPGAFPVVLGHEGAGIVRAAGPGVRDVAVGDHVLLSYSYCRECRSCLKERPYQCTQMFERNFVTEDPCRSQSMMWHDTPTYASFFGQSSFSNPAIVHEACCVRIDKKYPLEILAPLGCGVQTGAGSIFNVVKPIENEIRSLVVFGVGGVGSAAIMAAHALHIDHPELLTTIIAVDRKPDRLVLAKELGATNVINPLKVDNMVAEIRRITGGGGTDAAVDCTGAVPVINDMVGALGAGGVAVSVGAPSAAAEMSIEVFPFINGCKKYQASNQGNSLSRKFLPFLADLYMQNRLPIDRLQKQYRPSEINKAVQDMLEGTTIKPVIIWESC
ncbi:uncharacterized protein A1O5_00348 [Cladophialophora psammophila CBS 110553]|uniref:Enoyl reductase (ER) domain-containing protein n=1 Tax=Cladophialophora psammophila CBS 110553 TaxID=1182543 RepID=W9XFZ6_9EURO|nr:uncharacterized protein A1O5_00348 [Cladophialophora psammophila CBS 110553]EXJ75841.1 hypothetical protein A1O5_00348 [Cladophialophora psammophila CBS 110553]